MNIFRAMKDAIFTKAAPGTIASNMGLTDPRLYRTLGGGDSHAGEFVTVNSAMQLDTVWACVRLKSQTIATLPLDYFTRDDKGRGIINYDDPLYTLLHDQPNADMTSVEFWEAMSACLLLWGNAYAAIERFGDRVISVTPLRPDFITVRRQTDGSLLYNYAYMGQHAALTEDQVFHIKGFSLDGMMGLSPIMQGRESLGSAIAAEKASASFFRNGMRPSVVLTSPVYLTKEQRARKDEWISELQGAVNAGKIPLMEGGWTLSHLSLPPEDAQLLATRSFNVETLCRWFDVPPVMIGHTQSATAWGSGMEQMMLWFLQFSLRPVLKRIEQAIRKKLIPPADRAKNYAEFNVEGLLRADSHGRAAIYAAYLQHGLKTNNEVRALDNDPPMPGGDELLVQSNMLPLSMLGDFVRGIQPHMLGGANFKPPGPNAPSGSQAAQDPTAPKQTATNQ